MPRPRPPPTPASSTDIVAQERKHSIEMETVFTLPPPAMSSVSKVVAKASARPVFSQNSPASSPDEKSRGAPIQRKRTLSNNNNQAQNCALPPPPSRTRKIIQMKPRTSPVMQAQDSSVAANTASTPTKQTNKRSKTQNQAQVTGNPSTSTSRKIARKTAHSIIERRRRFKMNEEFGVLKDMVPACHGVEMHKLAILQAGIEYLKYLEGCITSLKERNSELEQRVGETRQHETDQADVEAMADEDDEEEDEEYEERDEERDMEVDNKEVAVTLSRPCSTAFTDDSASVSASEVQSRWKYDREQQYHPQRAPRDLRAQSSATSATNSTYASPDLRPVNSSGSLSNIAPRSSQTLYQQPSNQQHYRMGSQYSVLPPASSQKHSFSQLSESPRYRPIGSPPLLPGVPTSGLPTPTTSTPTFSSINCTSTSISGSTTGISPFIHAFNFSPDMNRGSAMSSYSATTSGSTYNINHPNPSPKILPLPQAALPLPHSSSSSSLVIPSSADVPARSHTHDNMTAEVTATAALMMMGSDRRGSTANSREYQQSHSPSQYHSLAPSSNQHHRQSPPPQHTTSVSANTHTTGSNTTDVNADVNFTTSASGKSMSVRDLLSN